MTNSQKGLSLLIAPLVLVVAITTITTCAKAGKQGDAEMLARLTSLQETVDAQGVLIRGLNSQLTSQTQTIGDLNNVIEMQTGVIEQLVSAEEGPVIVESNGGTMVCEWHHDEEQP